MFVLYYRTIVYYFYSIDYKNFLCTENPPCDKTIYKKDLSNRRLPFHLQHSSNLISDLDFLLARPNTLSGHSAATRYSITQVLQAGHAVHNRDSTSHPGVGGAVALFQVESKFHLPAVHRLECKLPPTTAARTFLSLQRIYQSGDKAIMPLSICQTYARANKARVAQMCSNKKQRAHTHIHAGDDVLLSPIVSSSTKANSRVCTQSIDNRRVIRVYIYIHVTKALACEFCAFVSE